MQQASNTLVIDLGSGYCKVGFSGEKEPRAILPFVYGQPKSSSICIGNSSKQFFFQEANEKRRMLHLKSPIQNGIIDDVQTTLKLLSHLIKEVLRLQSSQYYCLITQDPSSTKMNKEKICQRLLNNFYFKGLYFAHNHVLSLLSEGKKTGLVIDLGAASTSVVPIQEGKTLLNFYNKISVKGDSQTQFLLRALKLDIEDIINIKQKLSYVALDYEEELKKYKQSKEYESQHQLRHGDTIRIGLQKFQSSEIFFNPSLIGNDSKGIHKVAFQAINQCNPDIQKTLYENILITGGVSKLKGFVERFTKQIKALAPAGTNICVTLSKNTNISAWVGGTIFSSDPKFKELCISMDDYQKQDTSIIDKKGFMGIE